MPRLALQGLLRGALDLLFPARCPVCGRFLEPGESTLCSECLQDVALIDEPCPMCGLPGDHGPGCPHRVEGIPIVFAPAAYDGPWEQAIRAMKFSGRSGLARGLVDLLMPSRPFGITDFAALVPVPLHRRRLASRGYDQAALVARAVGARWGMPVLYRGLVRRGHTRPQAALDASARAANVAGVFEGRPRVLRGRDVVLVDDVITTGATVSDAARACREAGAKVLAAVALARTMPDRLSSDHEEEGS